MADDFIQIAPDSTGKKVDNSSLTVGGNTVYRQRISFADPSNAAAIAAVKNTVPDGTEYGLVSRISGTVQIQDSDVSGSGTINTADSGSTTTSTSPAPNINHNIITGTPTVGSIFTLPMTGESSFSGQITGTWSGTLQLERTVDGQTWTDVAAFVAGQPGTTKTFVANSAFHGNASAAAAIRIRATALSSGSATITLRTGSGTGTITLATPVAVKDATNPSVQLTIKPASTPAAATDTAVVTTPSPNGIQTIQGYQPATVSGSLTSATSVVGPISMIGLNVVTVGIFGTYAGVSCVFEGTADGSNWFTLQGSRVDTGLVGTGLVTATNAVQAWDIPIGAWTQFRVRATAWTSGTASVVIGAQTLPYDPAPAAIAQGPIVQGSNVSNPAPILVGGGSVAGGTSVNTNTVKSASTAVAATDTALSVGLHPSSPLPAGTNTLGLVNQGVSAAIGNAWFFRLTDGTNTAAVKAASAAAAAADPSLVTAFSPNSPLPTGTNTIGSINVASAPAQLKGVQASSALPVQDLKDSGRTAVLLNASGIASSTTLSLITMQSYRAGTVTTGIVDYVPASGKALRIQKCIITMRPTTPSTTATFISCTFALRRSNNATLTTSGSILLTVTGLVVTSSPSICIDFDIPDGLEFSAPDHIGFTQIASATGATFDLSLIGFEY